MEKHSFSYMNFVLDFKIKSHPFKNVVYRPILRITLSNGDRSVTCLGIVDSGADYSLFPGLLMKELGLEIPPSVTSRRVGSANETYPHVVKIGIPIPSSHRAVFNGRGLC
jgi:hypothetical protein